MLVDRYQIKLPRPESSATTINVPVDLTPQMVDQEEIIDRKFVEVEVENAINPILDYEKVRFSPALIFPSPSANTINPPIIQLQEVNYELNMLDTTNNAYFTNTSYADIGFDDDDLRFRKNKLTKSFLRLDFYDSDILTDQRLVASMAINPNITFADIQPNSQLYPVANKRLSFKLNNPLINNEVFGEGYFVYYFKDEVDINLPEFLYMRATFNNAKTGQVTGLMTLNNQPPIDDLVDQLHTRYVLHRSQTGYFYAFDDQYSSNILFGQLLPTPSVTIRLYEVRVA